MKVIKLTDGSRVKVDNKDYEWLSYFTWYPHRKQFVCYAFTTLGGVTIMMHRLIMNISDNRNQVDHIDHNGLNNQKTNLRIVTNTQNSYNRVPKKRKYIGIYKNGSNWGAKIGHDYKSIYLGTFKTQRLAAAAYNNAAKKIQGEFAYLNKL